MESAHSSKKSTTFRGLIAWMAQHPVAANLLMVFFLLGGLAAFTSVKQEVFPEIFTDTITISVSYPGSSPQEIERGVLQSIESAIQGVDGVKKITSMTMIKPKDIPNDMVALALAISESPV